MSIIEVVLLTPLVVGFIMILICFGVLVDVRGIVQGAARDAARTGSLERDYGSANAAAQQAASADLGTTTCTSYTVTQVDPDTKAATRDFAAGELYTIEVTCYVDLTGLNWFGLPTQKIVSYSAAPLDVFRRTG